MSFFKKLAKKLKKVVKVAAPIYGMTSLPGANFVSMAAGGDLAGGLSGISGMISGKVASKMSPAMPGVGTMPQDLGGVVQDPMIGARVRQRLGNPRRALARIHRKAASAVHRIGAAVGRRRRRRAAGAPRKRLRPGALRRRPRSTVRRRGRRMSALQRKFFGRRKRRR